MIFFLLLLFTIIRERLLDPFFTRYTSRLLYDLLYVKTTFSGFHVINIGFNHFLQTKR